MFKPNLSSAFIGYIRHINRSVELVRHVVLRNRYTGPTVFNSRQAVAVGGLTPRVVASDCLRYQVRNVHDGQQRVPDFAEGSADETYDQNRNGSSYATRTNRSAQHHSQQRIPPTDAGKDGPELGEWCESADVPDEVLGNFQRFRVSEYMADRLKAKGIGFLFPVQMSTFDPIFDGHDVIVQARTGSGKTLSYAIPLIEKLHQTARNTHGRPPQLLVMAPTRELTRQVSEVIESMSDKLSVACVYGGAPAGPQEAKIRSGIDVLVGTPGRIQDFLERRTLSLKSLDHVVLDEVDRMLDMGFADSVDEILKQRYVSGDTSKNPQTLLFSATIPSWVQQTARKYLRPGLKKLDLVGRGAVRTATTVEHLAVECEFFRRASVIANVLQVYSGDHGRAIVFCETKREADNLAASGIIKQESHVLHGDIPQEKRELVLKGFRDGRYKCLIATDVAARGLDIPEVDLVIQCSPSKDGDSYIHRSGRTGRAGRVGVSVLLYKPSEVHDLRALERTAGFAFKKMAAPSQSEIMQASAEDAASSLKLVSEATVENFKKIAETIIEERGAVPALAAALAVISGSTSDKQRSILTSRTGYTTYLFRTTSEMSRLGYAWRSLQRHIPTDVTEKITGMRFCADKQGCVFDIPSTYDSMIEERWQNGKYDSLIVASELPELLETSFPPRSNSNGDSKPWKNKRTGVTSRYMKARSSIYEDDEDSSNGGNPDYNNFYPGKQSNRKFSPSSRGNFGYQGPDMRAKSPLYEGDEDGSNGRNPDYVNFYPGKQRNSRKFSPSSRSNFRFQGPDSTERDF